MKHGGISLVLLIILFAGLMFLPWQRVSWGQLGLTPGKTITVVGQAKSQENNQIASFTAGVDQVSDNKEEAITQVNQTIKTLSQAVKDFGIKAADIKTQNLSIYQSEEQYYEEGVSKSRPGQWRVNSSITITLRDLDKADKLTELLTSNGATNVYGPNFTFDDTNTVETKLLGQAVANAQKKAESIAQANGKKVGQILSISEGSSTNNLFPAMDMYGGGGAGGAGLEPGSGTVQVTATVVFELK